MASNIPLFNKEIDDSPHGYPLECYRSSILASDNNTNMYSSDFPKIYGDNEDQIIQLQQISQQSSVISRKSKVINEQSNKAHSVQYFPCSQRQFLEDGNEKEIISTKAVNNRVNHKTFKRRVLRKQDKIGSVPCQDNEKMRTYDYQNNNEVQSENEEVLEEETKDNYREIQEQGQSQIKNQLKDHFLNQIDNNQDQLIINLNSSFTKENNNNFTQKKKISSSTDFTVYKGVSYSQNTQENNSQFYHEGSIIPFVVKNLSQNDENNQINKQRIQPIQLHDNQRLSVSLTDEATPHNHDKHLSTKNSYSPKETRNKQLSLMSPVSNQQDNTNTSQFITPTPLIEPLSGNQLSRKDNQPYKLPETLRFDGQNPTEESVIVEGADNVAAAEINNQEVQQSNPNQPQLEEEEQLNQQISNTRIRLAYRVNAIHSLRSLLQQKLTLKKMWLILHYFPLCLVFLTLAIHQTIAFCNIGITVHMYLFALLSCRNFFINIFVYQKLIRHVTVLELYTQKPFCHESLRTSLREMQQTYKSLENIQQKKKNTVENKKNESDIQTAENMLATDNQESLRQKSSSVNSQNINNLQQEDNEGTNQQKGLLDKDLESQSNKDNNQRIDQDNKILIESDLSLQKEKLIDEIFNLPLLVLHMNEEIQKKLLKAPNISNYQGQYIEWRSSLMRQSEISPNELVQTDLLIDIFQLLQRIADQNVISKELECAIKYGDNNHLLVKVLKIYQIFEEGYMMLYTIMQTTITFCSVSIGKVAIVFGFYFSVVRIVQLTAVVLSLSFITLGLVFYFFYKIIRAFKSGNQIKTVPFKKAKLIILKDTKITELDMDNAACVICYETFKDADQIFLSSCCQKCYHKACILEWFKKSKNCPLCRAIIS